MGWSLNALQTREQTRAEDQARSIAQVIVDAAVHAHLDTPVPVGGALPAADAADLRIDAAQLRRDGRLSALGIWQLDGTPLFSDQPAGQGVLRPAAADLERARRTQTGWTAPGAPAGGQPTLRVFLPTGPGTSAGSAGRLLVAVDVPRDTAMSALSGQTMREQVTLFITVALLLTGLIWLRRRLLRSERLARIDPVTELANRRALQEAAHSSLRAATDRHPAALLLLDLAEFKTVNDTLGHSAGDELLRQVAGALRGQVRRGDLVARLGGDEFAILLTDLPNAAAAQLRAEGLLAGLRGTSFAVDGLTLTADASIGVALAPDHGRTVEELLQHADVAMYQAKGGNRGSMLYDESFDSHTVARLALIAELRTALDRGEFVLHYQPKMALPDRHIYGAEALLRWQHPTRGLLPPREFLPLLESTGLIQPVTKWVLGEAARQAAVWRCAGTPLKVAVNMSTRSLLSPALPAGVLSILAAVDLPPSFLELEITETAIMTNPELASHVLTQLRARGVDVSIDDFGAGYTSLAFLRILPVTALKIDRSIVSHLLDNAKDEAVTTAVIDLGHRLGLRVIAEGVETERLLDRLVTLGCDRVQGFAVSHPLPADELSTWLAAQAPLGRGAGVSGGAATGAPPLTGTAAATGR